MRYNTAMPHFPKQDIDEILEQFREILEGNAMLSMSKHVSAFESDFAAYLGAAYAVATNSCTAALEISLTALGIGYGDEVIVPVQTFFATASAIVKIGAKPVFCNIDENFLLDIQEVEDHITENTKAVIIVHFAGLIHKNIINFKQSLHSRNIFLIEDCAHAHGANINGQFAGTFGDIGCYSFYSTKIMTMGEGGAIITQNKELYEQSKSLRNRGQDPLSQTELFTNIGSNHRLTELQAILGRYQLKYLDDFVAHRNCIADVYKQGLFKFIDKGLLKVHTPPVGHRHAYWRFIVMLTSERTRRSNIKDFMGARHISIDWPYSPLLHRQPAFSNLCGNLEGYKRSEEYAEKHFCLPIHLGIKKDNGKYIIDTLAEYLKKYSFGKP